MNTKMVIVLLLPLVFSGCSPEWSPWGDSRVNAASTVQLINKNFETFDDDRLARLISPSQTMSVATSKPSDEDPAALDQAVATFGADAPIPISNPPSAADLEKLVQWHEALRTHRNEVQGIILAASAQRCNVFKAYLRRLSSNEEFTFGSLATALGGTGAIVTGQAATRLFAGLAGISSGVGAQFQQDIMSNLSTSVIIPGIEKRRTELMTEIVNHRCLGTPSYSMTMAIADAIRFNGACSIDIGIAEASQSINRDNDVGITAMTATINKYNDLKAAIKDAASDTTPAGDNNKPKNPAPAPKPPAADVGGAGGAAKPGANAAGDGNSTPGGTQPAKPPTPQVPAMGDALPVINCGPLDKDGQLLAAIPVDEETTPTPKNPAPKKAPKGKGAAAPDGGGTPQKAGGVPAPAVGK